MLWKLNLLNVNGIDILVYMGDLFECEVDGYYFLHVFFFGYTGYRGWKLHNTVKIIS